MDTLDKGTLDKLQEMISQTSEPGKAPSRKVLLDMLDSVDLADDVKENLRTMLTGDVPKVFGGSIIFLLFIFVFFLLLIFFGYKLYKSIKEKEKKREEKKKAKQLKKKK